MINLSRKNKIIIAAVLLVLGLVVVLMAPGAKKHTLSVSAGIKDTKSVKSDKPAVKKSKIADSNQVSDSNQAGKKSAKSGKPAGKKTEVAGKSQVSDSNLAEILKKSLAASLSSEANDAKAADNNGVISSRITKSADSNVFVYKDPEADDDESMITKLSEVKPKAANMSANLDVAQSSIQSSIQSLVFMKNMPVTDALQLLAARYGKNIIPTAKVTGNLNFTKLNNVSFEEAMNAILGEGFSYQEQGNLIKVSSSEESSGKAKPDSSGMTFKVFTLYYISAAEAKKMVAPVMSSGGKLEITTAAETGVPVSETITAPKGGGDTTAINDMMVIYDFPEQIAQVEKVIAAIDIRPKQVLVEATILTATLTQDMQLGIDWQNLANTAVNQLSGLTSGSRDYVGFSGSTTQVGTTSLTGGVTIGVVRGDIATFIRAVEEITDVTILANPKILATNKQLGQVYIGTKVAYLSATTQTDTSTTQTVSFLDTGTKLSFRPYIGNDGYIRMDIHPKDSSAVIRQLGSSTSTVALPDETSAELITNIVVKDGETIVIGGLFREKMHNAKKQVPVLGNIPIVGTAFSSTADEGTREEVIVLLTPHIIGESSQTEGAERAEDIARKITGARKQLSPLNTLKIAQDHYEKATIYYVQGRNAAALKELDAALELYPDYLEAIRLKEKIYSEMAPSKKPARKIVDQVEQPQSKKWRTR